MNILNLLITFFIGIVVAIVFIYSWKIAFFLVLCLLILLFFLKDTRHGVYLTILSSPFLYAVNIKGYNFQLSEFILFIATITFVYDVLIHKRTIFQKSPYTFFILSFITLSILNILFVSVNVTKSIFYFIHFLEAFILFFMTLDLCRNAPKERANILKIILFTALIQACIGILQHVSGSFGTHFSSTRGYLGILHLTSGRVWHAVGTMSEFNILASFLAISICLIIPLLFQIKRRSLKVLFILILSAFIFTYSRGALLGLTVGAGYILLVLLNGWKRFLLLITFLTMAFILVAGATKNEKYMDTVGYEGRTEIWSRVWDVITVDKKAFLFGTGANTFEEVFHYPANLMPEQRKLWFAHNQYLLLWQEFGLIGLIIFVFFFLFIIFRNYCLTKISPYSIRVSTIGIVLLLIIHGFFDHQFTVMFTRNLFFVILAMSESEDA